MNRKKFVIGAIVALVIFAGAIFFIHQQRSPSSEEMIEKVEDAIHEVLGDDFKKVSATKVAATLTYSNGDEAANIYYHILETTYYEAGDPSAVTGLHADAFNALFPVDLMDSCEEMMIGDWYGALYKNDDKAYLCWTYTPEQSYVLEYNPEKMSDAEIIMMAGSAEPIAEE